MNFLIDEQLPPGLCHWLVEIGHAATHVNDLGLPNGEDETIWNHALSIDAIIITKDEDFAERTARTATGPVILWLRIGNSTNRVLLQWLEPRWSEITELLDAENRLIEVR
jgi:predicted nuclease of predicted toxin-antitoxin system